MGALGLLIVFLVAILIHIPISMGIILSCLYLCADGGYAINTVISGTFTGVDSFTLLAIPMFMLCGNIMCKGGIANRIVDFAEALVGHITGGFGMITIVACFFFAAIAGSAVATIGAIGALMIPLMIEKGYHRDYSCALASTASTMGPIVPPSVLFIPFGVMAGVSVSTMFAAGMLPGLLMGICMGVANYFICKKNGFMGTGHKYSFKETAQVLKKTWASLLLPVFILVCIYGGFCTPTEVAVVATVYALILGFFVYKELSIKDCIQVFMDTVPSAASVLIICGPAVVFGRLLALERIPQSLTAWVTSHIGSKIVFLLLINGILLIVGMFMETTSAIMILTPLFVPLANSYGVNTYHFGMIMIVNLAIGLCTPPMGLCAFIGAKMGGTTFSKLFKWLIPLLISLLIALMLITFIPDITYVLPELLGMKVR